MLTKGAIGNLVNRYRAVLKKCNLINTFGSLAVASMLVMGGVSVAEAFVYKPGDGLGETKTYTTSDNWDSVAAVRILGGKQFTSQTISTADMASAINSKIIVDGTICNDIIGTNRYTQSGFVMGGHYLDGIQNDTSYTFNNLDSTDIYIKNGQVEYIIAGSGHYNTNAIFNTSSTNLVIDDGSFGKQKPDTNCPESYISGGDLLKNNMGRWVSTTRSSIKSTNITINNGFFYTAILGGSVIIENYNYNTGLMSAEITDTATININGGTFKAPIIGGGFTFGADTGSASHGIKSVVTKAIINIDGSQKTLSIENNIYSGGLQGTCMNGINGLKSTEEAQSKNINTVSSAEINIKNATVKDVYGTNVGYEINYTMPPGEGLEDKHIYTPLNGQNDTLATSVPTALTFINSTANTIDIPKGSIELRVENNGTVEVAKLEKGDDVSVDMTADGATNDAVGGAAGTQGLLDSKFKVDKEVKTGSFTMDAGAITGKVTGTVTEGIADVTEAPNETNVAMADLPNINHMITRVEMNDLRKRMGDIRLLEGNTGLWARWDGGKLKGDSGLTNDFHKIQAGIDTTTGIDNLRLGAAFSYTNGDMEFAKADAESDTMSLAAYGVWTADNGMFADVIARLAFIDTEIQTDKVKGDLDNIAFSLSGEYGWRFDLCDKFFVEPQLELTYTYVDSDEFTSAGAKFDFDSTDSLIGRAGLAAGWKLPSELGELYARASVVQEFMGDSKLTASMGSTVRHYETDGDDTWFEYGVGANVKVTRNAYIFADVERTEGAEIDEEWRGTVGIRYSF